MFRSNLEEVLVKFLGDPFKKWIKTDDLSSELQAMLKVLKTSKLQPFKDVECINLDKLDSSYAFDPNCFITCNTQKEKDFVRRGTYIKRTRSAGWMGMFRTCNTRSFMYEMYRGVAITALGFLGLDV